MNPQEAQAALAAVEQSRSDIADRLITPWWYHPILGVLIGGLVTVALIGVPTMVLLGVLAVYAAGIAGLMAAYRRKARVWVGGFDGGPRSRRSLTLLFASILAIAILGAAFSIGMEIRWTAPITGLVVAVVLTIRGRRFDEVLRAELRESA
jgi:membrane associated rhomboid family serine protease